MEIKGAIEIIKEFTKIKSFPYTQDQLTEALQILIQTAQEYLKLKERMSNVENNLMYDFPKHYDNYQIMSYQNGIKKIVQAIKSLLNEEMRGEIKC